MSETDATGDDHEDHDETSVAGLWETARWFMRWLLAVCGAPAEIAAMTVLARKERRDILRWLLPVEALARRLLTAEAAQIAQGLPSADARRQGAGRRAAPPSVRRPAAVQDPEHPELWTARFALSPGGGERPAARRRHSGRRWRFRPRPVGRSDDFFERLRRKFERMTRPAPPPRPEIAPPPEAAPPAPAPSREPAALFDAFPLARRIEAVRRLLEDREAHVQRLARRLARRRNGDIARLRRACRPPPERSPYAVNRYGERPVRCASEHALQALAAFDTS